MMLVMREGRAWWPQGPPTPDNWRHGLSPAPDITHLSELDPGTKWERGTCVYGDWDNRDFDIRSISSSLKHKTYSFKCTRLRYIYFMKVHLLVIAVSLCCTCKTKNINHIWQTQRDRVSCFRVMSPWPRVIWCRVIISNVVIFSARRVMNTCPWRENRPGLIIREPRPAPEESLASVIIGKWCNTRALASGHTGHCPEPHNETGWPSSVPATPCHSRERRGGGGSGAASVRPASTRAGAAAAAARASQVCLKFN